MKFGRAGIIAAATRKKKLFDSENGEGGGNTKNLFLSEYQKQCMSDKRKKLVIQQYPLAVWFVGSLIMIIGLYLLYHVGSGNPDAVLFKGFQEGYWWQYFIACLILLLGVSFILAIKSEKITFDSSKDQIIIKKKNIFCCSTIIFKKLSHLVNIQIVKRGHDSISNKTIHYKMIFNFLEDRPIELLESNSKTTTKKRFIEIKNFLKEEVNVDNIPIIDESTSNRV